MNEMCHGELRLLFSRRFAKYRASHSLTQAQMAEILGIDTRSYIDLEHGKNLCCTVVLLRFLVYCGDEAPSVIADARKCFDQADQTSA